MREDQFIKLSQAGENVQIEYKTCYEQISDSLYETVCSFLNHSGGHILVGVKDNGEIAGVNPDKATTLQGNIITAIKNPDLFLPCPYFTPQIRPLRGRWSCIWTFLADNTFTATRGNTGTAMEMQTLM